MTRGIYVLFVKRSPRILHIKRFWCKKAETARNKIVLRGESNCNRFSQFRAGVGGAFIRFVSQNEPRLGVARFQCCLVLSRSMDSCFFTYVALYGVHTTTGIKRTMKWHDEGTSLVAFVGKPTLS